VITLITGLPGHGKTLYTLSWIKAKAEKENRPVFYARIKGLKLPWQVIDPFEWMKCPANAIVVIDEVQKSNNPDDPKSPTLFGVRKRGDPVPPWAAALETHRHMGIDLVLITQDPMLLDVHDRKLVGQHFHVKRTFGLARATVHEFGGCRPNVAQSTSGSVRHEWSYPKRAYDWYTSAEVHTVKARVPFKVWLFLSLPFIVLGLSWYAWSHYLDPDRGKQAAPVATPTALQAQAPPDARGRNLTVAQYVATFQPRVPGLAYTAPVYDDVTKPAQAPYPAACVLMRGVCKCYTQQGTILETGRDLCEQIVNAGFFVAWQKPEPPRPVRAPDPVKQPETLYSVPIALTPPSASKEPAPFYIEPPSPQRTVPPPRVAAAPAPTVSR
jgi:zona occludens toxin